MVASCARSTKTHFEFNISFEQFSQTQLTGQQRYLQLLAKIAKVCLPGSEKSVDINTCLGIASGNNNFILVNYFLNRGSVLRAMLPI